MPIYEYSCRDCGTRFESLRSMRDADAPIECIYCKSPHTGRLISLFSAHGDGKALAGGGGCSGCSGGSCAGCGQR